ncbi:pyrroloquinoline quinone biosynthesis peptide chaperone PqqD [Terasakiella sp. A23]|uniref:pyrroloquinoline quinone biosynthesis peptide chaperone PqqD n=1 Tax=Terasakiella sp. FCG-A23 TaxID=3080561 RepID=UPI00295568E7|nr:pyrroloquinoline quinone biosynthesis peptide chaperone PqqD [Terasakiella sp. A23]MDV7339324.1 pyrroloquinoline quinone biosynthesis peptide chaperone PqqD [Terasakiella sp. A23]
MIENSPINLDSTPTINPVYVFRWEESQKAHMLMYPEGLIKLNGPAGFIMEMIDGKRNVEQIITDLKEKFEASDELSDDVYAFMEVALEKGWIRV